MKRVKMTVSYEGTNYHGWQTQTKLAKGDTIQEVIEKALSKLTKEQIKIVASGRTDTGVHALGQVIHFDTSSLIPVAKLPLALQGYLPEDIVAIAAEEVNQDFHARYGAKLKTYRYIIDNGKRPNVLYRNYVYYYAKKLNIKAMGKACDFLVGTHDFRSFCASNTSVKDYIRTITAVDIWQEKDLIYLEITGNGFLYNMVRIIVGTLMEIGLGKYLPEKMEQILEGKNRNLAGPTAPAQGLTLMQVNYQ